MALADIEKSSAAEAIGEGRLSPCNNKDEESSRETRDWTDKEEKKIKIKLDLVLLGNLMLGFFALQLDKTNISSAITTTFVKDIGITNNIVNNGNQLLLAAIVIFEIPSNMMLAKFGAPTWLTFQCFSWGLVATFQAFINNKTSFYATRFLLGLFEAGYLAGALVVIGMFYTKQEIALRMTVLYTANYVAAGTSSLIAAGIFNLDGASGLEGWQWLFLIDGIFTVFISFSFLFLLPRAPSWTRPLVNIPALDVFNDRERDIMSRRIRLEDGTRGEELSSFSTMEAIRYLYKNYYIWIHALVAFISLVPKGGLLLYGPTIVKNLGFDKFKANILVSVCNYALVVLALIAARVSDKVKLRGPICFICTAYALIMAGVQYSLVLNNDKWAKYAVFVLFMAGNATFQGINSAWLSSNVRDTKAICVGQALVVMGANLGGLAGQQLFRDEDAPKYTNGVLAIMCFYAVTLVLVVLATGVYWNKNRKLVRTSSVDTSRESNLGEGRFQI
ncbi:major facilitator superfamily domain-containing protein [Fusarium venenatum]|uniref:major facilitator superfamily domain-containing protein n=1 Tax=Fusarium venenatum TaxID=56646 RepID=UPI001DD21003|nr:major facilitator superfamily domain-containing protein [Fusarium venenatum]